MRRLSDLLILRAVLPAVLPAVRLAALRAVLLVGLLAGGLSACFSPDLSQLTILCDATQPACPDGQTCVGNRCVGAAGDQGASNGDGGLPDQGQGPSGCADGSRHPVGVASACAGGYAVGMARQLCATGWHVCSQASGIDLTACTQLSGFFVADAPAYYQGNPGNESCGTGGMNPLWYGCGGRAMGVRMSAGCQGFSKLLDCKAMGLTCSAANQSLDTTGDTATTDGVLCCQ